MFGKWLNSDIGKGWRELFPHTIRQVDCIGDRINNIVPHLCYDKQLVSEILTCCRKLWGNGI